MILKKAMRGELDIMSAYQDIIENKSQETLENSEELNDEITLVENMKKVFLLLLGKSFEKFGAEIDKIATDCDKTELLRPIETRLKLLRNGNRMETSLMSDEETRFMWNLALALAMKHPAIAFRTYHMILSFITFHSLFMGPGYDLGEGSIWRTVDPDGDW